MKTNKELIKEYLGMNEEVFRVWKNNRHNKILPQTEDLMNKARQAGAQTGRKQCVKLIDERLEYLIDYIAEFDTDSVHGKLRANAVENQEHALNWMKERIQNVDKLKKKGDADE
ncbi:MAG: hypothetical protein ACTSW1_07205 [Candidatus Hodarchaeales archaeon]